MPSNYSNTKTLLNPINPNTAVKRQKFTLFLQILQHIHYTATLLWHGLDGNLCTALTDCYITCTCCFKSVLCGLVCTLWHLGRNTIVPMNTVKLLCINECAGIHQCLYPVHTYYAINMHYAMQITLAMGVGQLFKDGGAILCKMVLKLLNSAPLH